MRSYNDGDLVKLTGNHSMAGQIGIVSIDPSYLETDGIMIGGVHTRFTIGEAVALASKHRALDWFLNRMQYLPLRTDVIIDGRRRDPGNYLLIKIDDEKRGPAAW